MSRIVAFLLKGNFLAVLELNWIGNKFLVLM